MADKRRLQGDIDRNLKKVQEGRQSFQEILEKFESATNHTQKEKFEADLKKEIKKLQRNREQIKGWLTSNEIKDKRVLADARKDIETLMERFKIIEKETKTKAYSKEGLVSEMKKDPVQKEKDELDDWLKQCICSLNEQIEKVEYEIESMTGNSKKKRIDQEKKAAMDVKKTQLDKFNWHIDKLETIMRLLDNEILEVDKIKSMKDTIEYFISEQEDDDEGTEYLSLYDDLNLDELGEMAGATATAILASSPSDIDPVKPSDSEPTTSRSSSPLHSLGSGVSGGDTGSVTSSSANEGAASSTTSGQQQPHGSSGRERKKSEEKTIPLTKTPQARLSVGSKPLPSNTPIGPPQTPHSLSVQSPPPPQIPTNDEMPIVLRTPTPSANTSLLSMVSSMPSTGMISQHPSSSSAPMSSLSQLQSFSSVAVSTSSTRFGQQELTHSTSDSSRQDQLHIISQQQPQQPQLQSTGLESDQSGMTPTSQFFPQHLPTMVAHRLPPPPSFSQPPPMSSQPQGVLGTPQAISTSNQMHNLSLDSTVLSLASQQQLSAAHAAVAASLIASGQQAPADLKALAAKQAALLREHSMPPAPSQSSFMSQPGLLPSQHMQPSQPEAPATIALDVKDAIAPFKNKNMQQEKLMQQIQALENGFKKLPNPGDTDRARLILYKMHANAPTYYPKEPLKGYDTEEYYMKLDPGTLFFIFYYFEGTRAQYLAAKALKRMSWRFHTKLLLWFQRHEEPKNITDEYESGTYIYYDMDSMKQRKKENFIFHYSYLEDKDF